MYEMELAFEKYRSDSYLSQKEVGIVTGLSESTIKRMVASCQLIKHQYGQLNRFYFKPSEVDKVLKRGKRYA